MNEKKKTTINKNWEETKHISWWGPSFNNQHEIWEENEAELLLSPYDCYQKFIFPVKYLWCKLYFILKLIILLKYKFSCCFQFQCQRHHHFGDTSNYFDFLQHIDVCVNVIKFWDVKTFNILNYISVSNIFPGYNAIKVNKSYPLFWTLRTKVNPGISILLFTFDEFAKLTTL